MLQVDPNHTPTLRRLANYHARLADWERTAELHKRLVVATPDDLGRRYYLATLLVKLDRIEEYREHCRQLLADFGESTDLLFQRRAIQACLWHESGSQNHDQLVARIQAIFENAPIALHWRQTTLGLAHVRAGNPNEAKECLEQVLQSESAPPSGKVRAMATLALAYLADQDEPKASEILQQATQLYAEEAPEAGRQDLGMTAWHGWLICDVLLAEAKKRLRVTSE